MLATAVSGQAKHHPVYPGTRTVRGAIWDRLGGAWRLTEDALLKSERLRFIYSRHEPPVLIAGLGYYLRLLMPVLRGIHECSPPWSSCGIDGRYIDVGPCLDQCPGDLLDMV